MKLRFALVLLTLFLGVPAFARSHHRGARNTQGSPPGSFDYYVLSLSWSPDFCTSHPDAPECGGVKKFGFIVHGLWPQYERGYPKSCAGAPFDPNRVPAGLPNIMPSPILIQHEWESHGTCAGLSETDYFKTVIQAFSKVPIPADFKGPLQNIQVGPSDIVKKFARESGFSQGAFSLQCESNRFLKEVRVCLTKDLQGRDCSDGVRDTCSARSVTLRPLR